MFLPEIIGCFLSDVLAPKTSDKSSDVFRGFFHYAPVSFYVPLFGLFSAPR